MLKSAEVKPLKPASPKKYEYSWYHLILLPSSAQHEACSRAPHQTERPSLSCRAAQAQHGRTRTTDLLPNPHHACIYCHPPRHTASHHVEKVPVAVGQGKHRRATQTSGFLNLEIIQSFRPPGSLIFQEHCGN